METKWQQKLSKLSPFLSIYFLTIFSNIYSDNILKSLLKNEKFEKNGFQKSIDKYITTYHNNIRIILLEL